MKTLLSALLCLVVLTVAGQNLPNKIDLHTWKPPYSLMMPTGWTSERFPIPIEFAPQIPYKGVEELRFAPGWGKRSSSDYWSYAYVWWIEGSPTITAAKLQDYLKAYYSGLVAQNNTSRNGLPAKVVPTTASIKKVKTTGNEAVFSGAIIMLDYMGQSPITLNCLVHIKTCQEQKHTAVFVEISPKPADHVIWKTLHTIQQNFACSN